MNTLEMLKAGRAIIGDPRKWTQGAYSRDKNDERVGNPNMEESVKFCSVGALMFVGGNTVDPVDAVEALEKVVRERFGDYSLVQFNDEFSWQEVIRLWDDTIKRVEEEEKFWEAVRRGRMVVEENPGADEEERELEMV